MSGYLFNNGKAIRLLNDEDDIETHLDILKENFHLLLSKVKRLQKENDRLTNEQYKYKNEKFAEMQNKVDKMQKSMSQGFPISDAETEAITAWKEQHLKNVHKTTLEEYHPGTIGGAWTYTFLPTSIGTFGACQCNTCYKKAVDAYNHSSNGSLKNYIKKYDATFEWDNI